MQCAPTGYRNGEHHAENVSHALESSFYNHGYSEAATPHLSCHAHMHLSTISQYQVMWLFIVGCRLVRYLPHLQAAAAQDSAAAQQSVANWQPTLKKSIRSLPLANIKPYNLEMQAEILGRIASKMAVATHDPVVAQGVQQGGASTSGHGQLQPQPQQQQGPSQPQQYHHTNHRHQQQAPEWQLGISGGAGVGEGHGSLQGGRRKSAPLNRAGGVHNHTSSRHGSADAGGAVSALSSGSGDAGRNTDTAPRNSIEAALAAVAQSCLLRVGSVSSFPSDQDDQGGLRMRSTAAGARLTVQQGQQRPEHIASNQGGQGLQGQGSADMSGHADQVTLLMRQVAEMRQAVERAEASAKASEARADNLQKLLDMERAKNQQNAATIKLQQSSLADLFAQISAQTAMARTRIRNLSAVS